MPTHPSLVLPLPKPWQSNTSNTTLSMYVERPLGGLHGNRFTFTNVCTSCWYFTAGDLTQEGYSRKMARLDAIQFPLTSSGKTISEDLANPTDPLKQKIQELFGRAKTSPIPSLKTVKSAPPKKPAMHRKRITVVCIDKNMYTIPSRKARDKLVEEGKVKEVFVGKNEGEAVILEKLHRLFPSSSNDSFVLMKSTTGRDLIPASLTGEGAALLEITDGASLYVKKKNIQELAGSSKQSSSSQQSLQHTGQQSGSNQSALSLQHPGQQSGSSQQSTVSLQQCIGHVSQQSESTVSLQQHIGDVSQQSESTVFVQQNTGNVSQQSSSTQQPRSSLSLLQRTGNVSQSHQRCGQSTRQSDLTPSPQSHVTPQPTQQLGLTPSHQQCARVAPQPTPQFPSLRQHDQLLNKGVVHQQFLVGPQSRVYATVMPLDSTSKQFNKGTVYQWNLHNIKTPWSLVQE